MPSMMILVLLLRLVTDTRNGDDANNDDRGDDGDDVCLTIFFVVIECGACVCVFKRITCRIDDVDGV